MDTNSLQASARRVKHHRRQSHSTRCCSRLSRWHQEICRRLTNNYDKWDRCGNNSHGPRQICNTDQHEIRTRREVPPPTLISTPCARLPPIFSPTTIHSYNSMSLTETRPEQVWQMAEHIWQLFAAIAMFSVSLTWTQPHHVVIVSIKSTCPCSTGANQQHLFYRSIKTSSQELNQWTSEGARSSKPGRPPISQPCQEARTSESPSLRPRCNLI